jgi:hypothetical protein|tara:strand:- start:1008 stop:1364 length:357 start_codon:yes stop_codon:yes gene_type:complete
MAIYEDFTIDQGADVALQIELVNPDGSTKDLTGYSVAAKMKKTFKSEANNTLDFTAIVAQPSVDGIVTISLSNLQTDLLSARGRYVYDVEISYVDGEGNTIIERVLEGKIKVNPSVTR